MEPTSKNASNIVERMVPLSRYAPEGWEKVGQYRDGKLGNGVGIAASACSWLSERHPKETYRLRPPVTNKDAPAAV